VQELFTQLGRADGAINHDQFMDAFGKFDHGPSGGLSENLLAKERVRDQEHAATFRKHGNDAKKNIRDYLEAALGHRPVNEVEAEFRSKCAYKYKRLRQAFSAADKDGDGSLDKGEFRDMLTNFGLQLSPPDLDNFFAKYDDDSSGSINYREFTNKMQQGRPIAAQPKIGIVYNVISPLVEDNHIWREQAFNKKLTDGLSLNPTDMNAADIIEAFGMTKPLGPPRTATVRPPYSTHVNVRLNSARGSYRKARLLPTSPIRRPNTASISPAWAGAFNGKVISPRAPSAKERLWGSNTTGYFW